MKPVGYPNDQMKTLAFLRIKIFKKQAGNFLNKTNIKTEAHGKAHDKKLKNKMGKKEVGETMATKQK